MELGSIFSITLLSVIFFFNFKKYVTKPISIKIDIKIGLKIKENLFRLFAYMCLKKLNVFSLANFILYEIGLLLFFANLSEYSACLSSSFKIF